MPTFPLTRRFAAFAVVVAVLGAAGCGAKGPKLYPVSGKILIDDKAPEHATVVFHPGGPTDPDLVKPHGKVRADGTYTLTTYTSDDGAPAGDYIVTVELWLSKGRGDEGPKSQLPERFANPEKSGLKATVGEGPTEVPTLILKR
jgi:predicted small lipoprotein YifL